MQCNLGFIPVGKTSTTCYYDSTVNDFDWDLEATEFVCVEPIAFLIGGIDETYRYLNDVEILAPGFSCPFKDIKPYPIKVVGASAGFLNGQSIVCGGGREAYVDCRQHPEKSVNCDRNIECAQTTGGAQWCTGPKTNICYSYDPVLTKVCKLINY